MNASKVVERSPWAVDDPQCLWRPEGERMKGDPNVTNIDANPDAQETARQGTRAQEPAGEAGDVRQATSCCIVGGGPAGAMLGLLLARKGVDVVVLEKHGDFLRDFRGDTLHPSTMEIMDELGLAEKLLRLKHTKAPRLRFRTPQGTVTVADFRRLKTRFPYVAFMPQWDFLDFVTKEASRYPNFRLEMSAEVRELVVEDGSIRGVRYEAPDGAHEVRAALTVAADGRHSRVRERSGLKVVETGPPIDVLWFRLPRREGDPAESSGYIGAGKVLVLINRGDYWQTAYVIPKGADRRVREAGLEAFRQSIDEAVPYVADRTDELRDWEQAKLLSVQVDHLRRWHRPGLLCIGDAAHAMSPVGGVGINLAIQDAVAAANALAGPLLEGNVGVRHLRSVQRRREIPTRTIQGFQTLAHRRVFAPAVSSGGLPSPPAPLRALLGLQAVRDLPARVIAFGVWPVHVDC
jgi:2-polyprenyl-6-methoxyphenol hydroxylase-like FAD-dependent oxidoreductase